MVYYEVKFNCLLRLVFFIIILQAGAHWTIFIYLFIYVRPPLKLIPGSAPDSNGSRILITSRIKEVTLHASLLPLTFSGFLTKMKAGNSLVRRCFKEENVLPSWKLWGEKLQKIVVA